MQTHDDVVAAIVTIASTLEPSRFVRAFVASLSTRELVLREAFESFALLQRFEAHECDGYRQNHAGVRCSICDVPEVSNAPISVTLEGFNRLSAPAGYAASVLLRFGEREVPEPSEEDREILTAIFAALRALPVGAGLSQLERSLVGVLKSNKYERRQLLEALGFVGILCPDNELDYGTSFVPFSISSRRYPPGTKSDWRYPVRMWKGYAGVNERRIAAYFSDYL